MGQNSKNDYGIIDEEDEGAGFTVGGALSMLCVMALGGAGNAVSRFRRKNGEKGTKGDKTR